MGKKKNRTKSECKKCYKRFVGKESWERNFNVIRLAKIKIDLIKFLRIKNEQILVSKVHWYQIRIWFSLCLKGQSLLGLLVCC